MNCTECQDLLQLHLDGTSLGDRTGLDRHLAACPDCRGLHAAAMRLEDGLRLYTPPAPSFDLASRIVGEVLADRRNRLRSRRRWYAGAALAASLLLAVFLSDGGAMFRGMPDTFAVLLGKTPPVEQPGPQPEQPEQVNRMPSPIDLATQSGSAVVALPKRVVEETKVPTLNISFDFFKELPVSSSDGKDPAFEKATASIAETQKGMASAWETVESPMRRATSMWSQLTPTFSAKE